MPTFESLTRFREPTGKGRGWLLLCLLLAAALGACESSGPEIKVPARLLYLEAESLEDQGLFSEAVTKFQQVADENVGTRLGSFAYLRLAEIRSKQEKWVEAETNYRLFLTVNSSSRFRPYVFSRLLQVNENLTFTGVFFPEKEFDRDMQPSNKIITEYIRFFLLHADSIYLPQVLPIYHSARKTLAKHELLVADYYFRKGQFNAAAHRYYTLLRNFPDYDDPRTVLKKLISSYRNNQQQELAEEMERIYQDRFGPRAPGEKSLATKPPLGNASS